MPNLKPTKPTRDPKTLPRRLRRAKPDQRDLGKPRGKDRPFGGRPPRLPGRTGGR